MCNYLLSIINFLIIRELNDTDLGKPNRNYGVGRRFCDLLLIFGTIIKSVRSKTSTVLGWPLAGTMGAGWREWRESAVTPDFRLCVLKKFLEPFIYLKLELCID